MLDGVVPHDDIINWWSVIVIQVTVSRVLIFDLHSSALVLKWYFQFLFSTFPKDFTSFFAILSFPVLSSEKKGEYFNALIALIEKQNKET